MAAKKKTFSICIPVKNTKKYLDECLKSVFEQKFRNFEVIIVDNGSTDGSGELLDEYARQYPFIQVIHQKDQGLLNSRRTAIKHAVGEYICFLDSDDYWCNDYLEKCNEIISQNKCDILSFSYYEVSSSGTQEKKLYKSEGLVDSEEYTKYVLKNSILNNLWLKVVRRSLFDMGKNYEYFNLGNIIRVEGAIQTYEILSRSCVVYVTNAPLYYYRMNGQGLMSKGAMDLFEELKKEYSIFMKLKFVQENKFPEEIECFKAHDLFNIFIIVRNVVNGDKSYRDARRYLYEMANDQLFIELSQKNILSKLKISRRIYILLLKNKMFLAVYWVSRLLR